MAGKKRAEERDGGKRTREEKKNEKSQGNMLQKYFTTEIKDTINYIINSKIKPEPYHNSFIFP